MRHAAMNMMGVLVAGSLLSGCSGTSTCDGVGEMCRVAGTGDQQTVSTQGQLAVKTPLYFVSQVRQGPDGRVYVMEQNGYKLHAIDPDGKLVTVAGTGVHSGYVEGAPPTQSPFYDPTDLAWRPDGRLVIVSWHDGRLGEIGNDGRLHTIFGAPGPSQPGGGCTGSGDGGPATAATFCELDAIAIDSQGRIFVADDSAHGVRMIDTDGTVSTIAGGTGIYGYDGDGGPAAAAHLDTPQSLALDGDDNLYIADTMNDVIRKVDLSTRVITTVAGNHHAGFSGDGGPCRQASFHEPGGVAVDTDGTLYVSDSYNNRIRKIDLAADVVSTIAGDGMLGLVGDGGPALNAEVHNPARLTISDGTLYIADFLNNVARSIRLR